MQLTNKQTTAAVPCFKWRDRRGVYHRVTDMDTRHIFYTLRMIWNHTMPVKTASIYNRYAFGATYTKEYLTDAVRALAIELSKRDDLGSTQTSELNFMISYLAKNSQSKLGAHYD